jgi:hypothetical protein
MYSVQSNNEREAMQIYTDPTRASDPHALPDAEVFHVDGPNYEALQLEAGWYWWACFPGCLPDGEPCGPFATKDEAIADAQQGSG